MTDTKPQNKGKLHSALGVKKGGKIPAKKQDDAKPGSALSKEITFAKNAKDK